MLTQRHNWLAVAAFITTTTVNAQSLAFTGTAFELESEQIQYLEHHEIHYLNSAPQRQTVRYESPDGNMIALKTMRYQSPVLPAYRLEIPSLDRVEIVEPGEKAVTIQGKTSGEVAWPDNNAVIDAGFHYFIQRHFERLANGESVHFQFLAPSRLTWTPMIIEAADIAANRLELKLSLKNRLIAWVIDPIHLVYDRADRRLLEYRGLTNLPKPGGGNYRARIEYRYPGATQ